MNDTCVGYCFYSRYSEWLTEALRRQQGCKNGQVAMIGGNCRTADDDAVAMDNGRGGANA